MASRRRRIIEALATRLEGITVAGGYNTDAGLTVLLGEEPTLGPDDPDVALSVSVGDTTPGDRLPEVMTQMPIEVLAIAKADIEQPLLAIEDVIADIRTAVETSDKTLAGTVKQMTRGPVRAMPRESGSTVVGAGVEYVVLFGEKWGDVNDA